jgi:hypothetical protein
MHPRSRILTAAAGICITGVLSSCASTHVAGAWKVPSADQVAPRRVLVLAVLGNTTSRRAIEDAVVRQLGQAGVNAVAGYSVAPDTGDLAKPRLAQTLADCGADAALVCRWHLVKQTTFARAGGGSGAASANRVQQKAYGDATLLAGATLGTLWSAATTSDQVGGFRDAAPEYARTLVGALQGAKALCCSRTTAGRGHAALAGRLAQSPEQPQVVTEAGIAPLPKGDPSITNRF